APRRDVAEEAQGIRLVTPCLVCPGMRQYTLGEDVRVLQTAGQRLQDDILASRGEREGALGGGDRLVIGAHTAEMDGKIDGDLSQPTRVVEGLGEGLGLAQSHQDMLSVARRPERRAQGEAEINGLLAHVTLRWQMRQGTERLLEVPHSLT